MFQLNVVLLHFLRNGVLSIFIKHLCQQLPFFVFRYINDQTFGSADRNDTSHNKAALNGAVY